MIKRRFYRQEHRERDGASSDSSSSSDSDLEAQSAPDSDAESQPQPDPEPASDVVAYKDDDDGHAPLRPQLPSSSSSGYESEDSSANEIDADSAGIPAVDDDNESGSEGERLSNKLALGNENGRIAQALAKDHPLTDDIPTCILRCKSVFKCRLCPKIVCLNMESLRAHLQSKRHARSEKLLNDGRLKRILNSDGEEEVLSDDDGETHAERHARIVALAQGNPKKKSRGRQRQRQRLKRKKQKNVCEAPNSGQQMENRSKRRRKNVN